MFFQLSPLLVRLDVPQPEVRAQVHDLDVPRQPRQSLLRRRVRQAAEGRVDVVPVHVGDLGQRRHPGRRGREVRVHFRVRLPGLRVSRQRDQVEARVPRGEADDLLARVSRGAEDGDAGGGDLGGGRRGPGGDGGLRGDGFFLSEFGVSFWLAVFLASFEEERQEQQQQQQQKQQQDAAAAGSLSQENTRGEQLRGDGSKRGNEEQEVEVEGERSCCALSVPRASLPFDAAPSCPSLPLPKSKIVDRESRISSLQTSTRISDSGGLRGQARRRLISSPCSSSSAAFSFGTLQSISPHPRGGSGGR